MPSCSVYGRRVRLPRRFRRRCKEFVLLRDAAGVVPVAGEDGQPLTLHAHFDVVVILRPIRLLWDVREGVLITGLLGYPGVQLFQRFPPGRVVYISPGSMGICGKPLEFAVINSASHTHTKDGDVVALQLLHGVVVGVGVVLLSSVDPVADDKDNFSAVSRPALQKLGSAKHGIIQRFGGLRKYGSRGFRDRGRAVRGVIVDGRAVEWPAGRHDGSMAVQPGPLEFRQQLVLIAGEAFAGVEELVETANKGLIEIAEASHDGIEALLDLLGIL